MDLEAFQRQFSAWLTTGESNTAFVDFFEDGNSYRRDVGLSIYRRNALSMSTSCLEEAFPVTRKLLMSEVFDVLARQFARSATCEVEDLNAFGSDFPDFLDRRPDLGPHRYVGDLARLDWAWHRLCYAPSRPALGAPDLLALLNSGRDLVLRLRDGMVLINSEYSVLRIWEVMRNDLEEVVDPTATSERVALWRDVDARSVQRIEEELWPVITGIAAGLPLATIGLSECFTVAPKRLHECLQVLLARGWLAAEISESSIPSPARPAP